MWGRVLGRMVVVVVVVVVVTQGHTRHEVLRWMLVGEMERRIEVREGR